MLMQQTRTVRRLGWKPDLPDYRDHVVSLPSALMKAQEVTGQVSLAKTIRLDKRKAMYPERPDQGDLGSCVGNGVAGATYYTLRELKLASFLPSRLAIYLGARTIEGSQDYDSGAYIRDGIKVVAKQGAGHESLWPYDIEKFTMKPSVEYEVDAAKHKVTEYARVPQTKNAIMAVLAGNDPIVFGFSVYTPFLEAKVAKYGIVPLPKDSDTLEGGHCVWMCGYGINFVYCVNSWGPDWGRNGVFSLPWDYVLDENLADDFWRITIVAGEKAA